MKNLQFREEATVADLLMFPSAGSRKAGERLQVVGNFAGLTYGHGELVIMMEMGCSLLTVGEV